MHLTVVPLTAARVTEVAHLWGDRDTTPPAELSMALDNLQMLITSDRARGSLAVDETGRVRGFGASTFVESSFVDRYLRETPPQIGRQILTSPHLDQIVLDDHRIGSGNAGAGLNLVVLNQGFDLSASSEGSFQPLAGTMIGAFLEVHRGFRLQRIINEIFGVEGVELVTRVAPGRVVRRSIPLPNGEELVAGAWILDRLEAEREGGLILPMFTYAPPKLSFTRAERQLLMATLSGATLETIAGVLGLSVPAVKSRWRRIIEKTAAGNSDLASAIRGDQRDAGRGAQVRHLIVEYIRANPSELTPYYP